MSKSVLLGFSGGIDSTAAVGILQKDGYRVTALTLDTTGDKKLIEVTKAKARELGIELIIDDVREEFEQQIVSYFIDKYMSGATPAPCTLCNPNIKWRRLDQVSQSLGIEHIATGHYFRVGEFDNKKYVMCGIDPIKDQSYYLWGLSQHILGRILTPMGTKIKSEVKAQMGIPMLSKESMGVCFLSGMNYSELLRSRCGDRIRPGQIVDRNGSVVGRHDGFPYYTIGQKRGLELFDSCQQYCIIGIDPVQNQLIIGEDRDLYHHNLIITDCNIVNMDEAVCSTDITVKIRGLGRNPQGSATVSEIENEPNNLRITLSEPAWAAAKAQPVVLYRGERVVGGGFLENYF